MLNEVPAAVKHEFGPPAVQCKSQAPPGLLEEYGQTKYPEIRKVRFIPKTWLNPIAARALSATWRWQIALGAEVGRSPGASLGCRSSTSCARVLVLGGCHAACVVRVFGLFNAHCLVAPHANGWPTPRRKQGRY